MSIGTDGISENTKYFIREQDNELLIEFCKPFDSDHILNKGLLKKSFFAS